MEKLEIFKVAKHFTYLVKDLMRHDCINLTDLSIATKINRIRLFRIVNGQDLPNTDEIDKIARYFGFCPSYFLEENLDTEDLNRLSRELKKILEIIQEISRGVLLQNACNQWDIEPAEFIDVINCISLIGDSEMGEPTRYVCVEITEE